MGSVYIMVIIYNKVIIKASSIYYSVAFYGTKQ